MRIREFKESDYEEVAGWWGKSGEPCPPLEAIPKDTYIFEGANGTPFVCLSLVGLTDGYVAWSMGLVANPMVSAQLRRLCVKELWQYVENVAKQRGYKHLFCIAPNQKLETRYKEIGFVPTKQNVSMMIKDL